MRGPGSVRDRGGGTSSPSPRAATPKRDIPTVQHMGRTWRRTGHGCSPAPPRIRFPTSSTPDTISRRLHPGHGCSPDIATHGPRPRWGGGGAPQARAGWGHMDYGVWGAGDRGGGTSSPAPRAATPRGDIPTVQCMGRSWGRTGHGCSPDIASTATAPAAGAGEERRRRGRGGGRRQKGMGIPTEARAGWGLPTEV